MLIKADAAQIEWRVKVFLSQDAVALRELQNNEDLHSANQKAFRLPNRTIAKNFLYRMIFADAFGPQGFGGPAYAYANDPDYSHVSGRKSFWEGVIERFYEKYSGVYQHSANSIAIALETGRLTNPSGRFYKYEPFQYPSGDWDWPRSDILNYPVQGLAADWMTLARRIFWRRLKTLQLKGVLLVNTVHDDIEVDVDNDPKLCYTICMELENCFAQVPAEFERTYGVKVNVPLAGEAKLGWTLFEEDMVKFNKEDFNSTWVSVLTKQPASFLTLRKP